MKVFIYSTYNQIHIIQYDTKSTKNLQNEITMQVPKSTIIFQMYFAPDKKRKVMYTKKGK